MSARRACIGILPINGGARARETFPRRVFFDTTLARRRLNEFEWRRWKKARASAFWTLRSKLSLFGRKADDPDIIAFVDMLRGMGLRLLLEADDKRRVDVDLDALAARFGLRRTPEARL